MVAWEVAAVVGWDRGFCIAIAIIVWLVVTMMFMRRTSWCHHHQNSTLAIPPGSLGFPLIGETLDFLAASRGNRGLYDFVHSRRLRYGSCFKTNIYGRTHIFLSSIKSAKTVLMSNDEVSFSKRYIRSIAELVGKESLLCASPQGHHKLLRGRLSALFTTDVVSLFVERFDHLVLTTLSHWERRETVVVLHEALSITFKAMCRMLMSMEDPGELETLQKDVTQVCEAMVAIPLKLPYTRFYKGVKARKRIMETLRKMIEQRRKGLEQHEDFMKALLVGEESSSSSDNASVPLTDIQIQDNILTMIIAGQDTTASAMTWMVKYLDENQDVQEMLRAEQLQLISKTPFGSVLTVEDLNEMPYASKVVKESLRMASVVSWFPRVALSDCEVEGFKIKKGWIVNIDARSIHLDPTVYHDPNKFYPSRFDDESKPYSFLAFGIGGRTCLGTNLAKAMMLVFLHRLVTMYRWKVIDPDPSLEKWSLFAKLRSGCSVSVMPLAPK
ncbi:abscisic acid 8'-hydroxylase 3 [Macadamia integrifolia]|uniref:abscisic acid 8'-hydroxylase 3 n=1 Tax=Macadamia integrifolia TaxID=60698 RepID=UPI001C4FA240|nr:abscisic acid 8'-hydroxylase 3 [Macadamia integrifolia]